MRKQNRDGKAWDKGIQKMSPLYPEKSYKKSS